MHEALGNLTESDLSSLKLERAVTNQGFTS